ncbi:MAG: 2-amino-4-hydroxy-6-hydroxymethyldihydropteridine diphosphokinase [Nitrospirota bacterium]
MSRAYIGIGSNLGNREDNCERAIRRLSEQGIKVTRRSSMIETKPWGVTEQPDFINLAIEIETGLKPDELLFLLKTIEAEIGRQPAVHWGPRVVDLDILLYDDIVIKTHELEVPHPHLAEREFVLGPLAEIAPEVVHPVLKKSIRELLMNL